MVTPSRMWANIGASSHLTAPKRHPCTKTFMGKWYPFRFHMVGVVSLCHQSLGKWHYWDGQNVTYIRVNSEANKGHFTHKTESPWPWHFKHSHWWKRRSRCKFSSHYAWGTNGVCECKMVVKFTWISTWHRVDHVSWLLGLFSKTTPWR